MKYRVSFDKLKNEPALRDYVEKRLAFAFSRVDHVIERVKVTIADVNGPKGGVDKQCKVYLKPVGMDPIFILERQADSRVAVDRGISRANQSLLRQFKRRQKSHRPTATDVA